MMMIIFYSAFFLFSVFISVSDIKTGTVSRSLMWVTAAVLFLLKYIAYGHAVLALSAIGCILGLCVFLLAYFCSKKKLGLADVWYAGIMGIVLGPFYWYPAVFFACVIACLWILAAHRHSLPFLPFMAAGAWLVLIYVFISDRSV